MKSPQVVGRSGPCCTRLSFSPEFIGLSKNLKIMDMINRLMNRKTLSGAKLEVHSCSTLPEGSLNVLISQEKSQRLRNIIMVFA